MSQLQVSFICEVTDKGDSVVAAEIMPTDGDVLLDPAAIHFTVADAVLAISSVKRQGTGIHFDFASDSQPLVLQFDLNKFVNSKHYPTIQVTVDNLPSGQENDFVVSFTEPPFLEDFADRIYQYQGQQLAYYEYETGTSSRQRPLVVFLHGSGERGFYNQLPLLGNDVPKTIHDYIKKNEDAILLVPQTTWTQQLSGWFRPEVRRLLMALIQSTIEKENIDRSRIYLIGLSNGGAATWHLAERHPELFSAIIPCCGYIYEDHKQFLGDQKQGRYMLPTESEAERLRHMPVWAFHAEDDDIVNVAGTKQAIALLKAAGNQSAHMTLYPAAAVSPHSHACWELAFNNKELLPWLFTQRKEENVQDYR